MNDMNTDQMITFARQSLRESDVAGAAAYASLATVELMQQFLALAHEGLEYEWHAVELPDGGGSFRCVCGAQAFTEYPTPDNRPYILCASSDCPAVWDLGTKADVIPRPRRVLPVAEQKIPWNVNDLVRHRKRYATPVGEQEADLVCLLQRRTEGRPGWWSAMVLRSDPLTGVIVGQSVSLNEHGPNNVVARFPD